MKKTSFALCFLPLALSSVSCSTKTNAFADYGYDALYEKESSKFVLKKQVGDSSEAIKEEDVSPLAVQYGKTDDGQHCIRVIAAIAEEVNYVLFSRSLVLEDGTTSQKDLQATSFYSFIMSEGMEIAPNNPIFGPYSSNYTKFACYTMRNIPEEHHYAELSLQISFRYEEEQEDSAIYRYKTTNLEYFLGLDSENVVFSTDTYALKKNFRASTFKIADVLSPEIGMSINMLGIPSCVNIISENAMATDDYYENNHLQRVFIHEGVTEIRDEAFINCLALQIAYLPASLKTIGKWSFAMDEKLHDIYYAGTLGQWGEIKKSYDWAEEIDSTCLLHCSDVTLSLSEAK